MSQMQNNLNNQLSSIEPVVEAYTDQTGWVDYFSKPNPLMVESRPKDNSGLLLKLNLENLHYSSKKKGGRLYFDLHLAACTLKDGNESSETILRLPNNYLCEAGENSSDVAEIVPSLPDIFVYASELMQKAGILDLVFSLIALEKYKSQTSKAYLNKSPSREITVSSEHVMETVSLVPFSVLQDREEKEEATVLKEDDSTILGTTDMQINLDEELKSIEEMAQQVNIDKE